MKQVAKISLYLLFNLLLLLVLLWSLMIYTSLEKGLPWYEPCGMQFLVIFCMSDPAFLVLGIALFILGRFYRMRLFNKLLPFIAIAGLSLPILIDGSLSRSTLLAGTLIGAVLVFLVIAATIRNLLSQKRRQIQ